MEPKKSSGAKSTRGPTGDVVLGATIRKARKAANLTPDDLGVSKSLLSQYETGWTMPPTEFLVQLAAKTGWSVDGILRGDNAGTSNVEEPRRAYGGSRLPRVSWVAAGNRSEAVDPYAPGAAFEWIDFDSPASKSAICLQVRGDSMIRADGSGFPNGCYIAVEPRRTPKSGDFVVVRFNDSDEAAFKQYFIEGGTQYLRPLNPTYPTLGVPPDAQMVGVVFEKRIIEKF